jgi:DNA-binding LacI/PurR family transcriptional regulator
VPEAGYFLPPLTTVRQDFAELGRRSLEVILAQLREEAPAGRDEGSVLIEPALAVRGSTAPPTAR